MPNPFKRSGNAYLPPEWIAPDVGLIRLLDGEDVNAPKLSLALIGSIGSGKTTALDWYRARLQKCRPKDIVLREDVGKLGLEALGLHRLVLRDLGEVLGEDAYEETAKSISQAAERDDAYLSERQTYLHLGELVEYAENSGRRVHLLHDECQFMGELGSLENDAVKVRQFWNLLKNLAETLTSRGGCMAITITATAWNASTTPPVVQARFVVLDAGSLAADEIQRFATMGLTRTEGELPTKVDADVGAAVSDSGVAKIRDVHDLLFKAWRRANRDGADTLTKGHLL